MLWLQKKGVWFALAALTVAAQWAVLGWRGERAGLLVITSIVSAIAALAGYMYISLSGALRRTGEDLRRELFQSFGQVESLFSLYSTLRPRRPLPAMRGMAISPDFAGTLAATVFQLRPRTILELGSGVSTLIAAYCLEQLGCGRIISLDHEQRWAGQTRSQLQEHGLTAFATVVHAPLREAQVAGSLWLWYDLRAVSSLPEIDLLVVDGPPADTGPLARYPAVPLLFEHLSDCAVILVDDAARGDDHLTVERWVSEFPGFSATELPHEKGTVVLRRRPGDTRLPADRIG